MTAQLNDPFEGTGAQSTAPEQTPGWPVYGALAATALGIAVAAAEQLGAITRSATFSISAYVIALVVGTPLLGWYRWRDGKLSRLPSYDVSPRFQRLAVLAAVLIVAACALNGYVVSAEWSKR
jgi:hypothetical protein